MKRWLNFSQLAWGNHRDKSRAGYTITEVMIVLAISASMFIVVALLLQGRQKAAQYTEAIRDLEGRIQTMASDVQKGYFANTFDCEAGASGPPVVRATSNNQPGTNEGCVFMGKVMKPLIDGNTHKTQIITMVGRRTIRVDSRKVATESLADAQSVSADAVTSEPALNWGLEITRMTDIDTGDDIDGFAFMANLAGTVAGSITPVGLYALTGAVVGDPSNFRLAQEGIRICVMGPTGEPGEVTMGASGDQLSTNVVIGSEACA